MKITIAICTWNRAALLYQTLKQMQALVIPCSVEWELIVVDNNSTDTTQQVVRGFESTLPIRYVKELKQGIANARNCALDHARGEWLLFADDDVLVQPDWVASYLNAFSQFSGATFAGGTISPWFSIDPPDWVLNNLSMLQGPFAIREFGPDVRWLAPNESLYTANFAVKMETALKHRFRTNLGKVGNEIILGEDEELVQRMRKDGAKGIWVGSAKVAHYIPKERLTPKYVKAFAHGYGRTVVISNETVHAGPTLLGMPRWALKIYLRNRAMELILAPFRSRLWLHSLQQAAIHRGIIDQHFFTLKHTAR